MQMLSGQCRDSSSVNMLRTTRGVNADGKGGIP